MALNQTFVVQRVKHLSLQSKIRILAILLFTISLILPAFQNHNGEYPQGWECLLGSIYMLALAFDSQVSYEKLVCATFLPTNVCILLLPLVSFRRLHPIVWGLLPVLCVGSLTAMLFCRLCTQIAPGYVFWLASIYLSLISIILTIRCTNNPMHLSGGSAAS